MVTPMFGIDYMLWLWVFHAPTPSQHREYERLRQQMVNVFVIDYMLWIWVFHADT